MSRSRSIELVQTSERLHLPVLEDSLFFVIKANTPGQLH